MFTHPCANTRPLKSVHHRHLCTMIIFTEGEQYDAVGTSTWLELEFTQQLMDVLPDKVRASARHIDGHESLGVVEIVQEAQHTVLIRSDSTLKI